MESESSFMPSTIHSTSTFRISTVCHELCYKLDINGAREVCVANRRGQCDAGVGVWGDQPKAGRTPHSPGQMILKRQC